MAMFNKIMNVLVLVLSVCAVVFGFFLFEKRDELRNRGDKMAKVINTVSATLDRNSNTEIAKLLVPGKLELDSEKDAAATNNLKISLYHDNYKNLETVLRPFQDQANLIMTQRDILGITLNNVMITLEVPQADNFASINFQHVDRYEDTRTELLGVVKKVNDRDNALVRQIADSAKVIGFTLDPDSLKNLDDFNTPLQDFDTKVSELKTRSDAYASHIESVCRILEISSPSLEGSDYAESLTTARTGVQDVKDEFEATKVDLRNTKQKLAETETRLNQEIEKVAKLEAEVVKHLATIDDLLGRTADGRSAEASKDTLVNMLEGNVLRVNKKWDFVVIDLGREAEKNVMIRGTKEKPTPVTVALPEGKVMDIARGNRFLGQIKITRVNDNCAIGDIIGDTKQGDIETGDRVFFARAVKPDDGAGGAAAPVAGGEVLAAPPPVDDGDFDDNF